MHKKQILIRIMHKYLHVWLTGILYFYFSVSITAIDSSDSSDDKIRTIVIDPGHGGKDSGARGSHSFEKDVVLDIGLMLGEYINENIPDVKVVYTRTTDEFIPLYRRAEIANEVNADLFISLHANGWSNPKTRGTETLVLGLHRSDENFEVAKRENSVILLEEDYTTRYENFDPNSLESYIIFSLMQNVYDHQSISFADYVQNQFRERARRKDRGVRRQGLLVLAQTSMPGVLIEVGFITNPDEEKYINSKAGKEYLASAIFRAFREYKNDIENKSYGPGLIAGVSDIITDTIPDTTLTDSTVALSDTPRPYFKVQILSSDKSIELDSKVFSTFNNIEEFKVDSSYKYAVGHKQSYDEIVAYSKWVKSQHPDAFIIAVKNNTIIPVEDALKELKNN